MAKKKSKEGKAKEAPPVAPSTNQTKIYSPGQGTASYVTTQSGSKLDDLRVLWQCYDNNYWVRKCLKAIAYAGSKKWEIVPRVEGEEVDPDKVARIETFLNNLNPQDTFEGFLRKLFIYVPLYGHVVCEVGMTEPDADLVKAIVQQAFLAKGWTPQTLESYDQEVQDTVGEVVENGIPNFLRIIPTTQVEVVADKSGNIVKYVQYPEGKGNPTEFVPSQVLHILHPDAESPTYGESQIACLSNLLVVDQLIDVREKNKLQDDNAIDTLIKVKNGTEENLTAVGTEFQTRYGGVHGSRFIAVDGDEIAVEDISKSKDADFLKEKQFIRDTIAMTLGVPLSVLGVTEGTAMNGAGADTHHRNFIENTVRPLAVHLEAMLNRHIMPHFVNIGIDYIVKLVLEDTSDQADLEEMYDVAIRNGTMTINEKRELMNQPKFEDCGDMPIFTQGGVAMPLKALENPPAAATTPAPLSEGPTADGDELAKAVSDAHRLLRTLRKAR